MPTSTPVQLLTVPADVLRDQQWDLAVLFLQALARSLTVQEVATEVAKLRAVLDQGQVSWTTKDEPTA